MLSVGLVVGRVIKIQAGHQLVAVFGVVLEGFDAQKRDGQADGGQEHADQLAVLAVFGEVNAHGDGEAAAQQNCGIERPERDAQVLAAGLGEGVGVEAAIHHERRERAAEEHELGGEEGPHAERGGFFLLRQVFKLVRQVRTCFVQKGPLPGDIDKEDR